MTERSKHLDRRKIQGHYRVDVFQHSLRRKADKAANFRIPLLAGVLIVAMVAAGIFPTDIPGIAEAAARFLVRKQLEE
ncbi:MAG: hypothetical protein PVF26_02640 [Desulfobacterales bacterium]